MRRISLGGLNEHGHTGRLTRGARTEERGASLLGLLIVVLVLGVMAAVTLGGLGFTPNEAFTGIPSTMPGGGAVYATTTAPRALGARASAARAACRHDFETVQKALHHYEVSHGRPPPPGRAWALRRSGGSVPMETWPGDARYFHINWDGSKLSAVPNAGAASRGSAGTSSPASGCFAVAAGA